MKKLLALVLALVMTLGLATVGTNAAYADQKDINYDEAVTVLSTIGILKGDESGFRPGETLKRSEGAKIIAYLMLGNETAEAMVGTGTKFTDVPASHWAAGYIEYLTTQKVISGVGGGKFDPDGQLTTNQFAKMLLVALGFDAGIEGLTGADWAINTQKLANLASVDLFDGNDDAKGNEAIKREEAALYAFNVLQTPLVTYDSKGTEIAVNGAEIKFAASNWKYETEQVGRTGNANNISAETVNDSNGMPVPMIEFAEKYYTHLTLVDQGNSCDDLGRPVRKWNWYNAEIGTFTKSNELVKTWTAKVTSKMVYDELGKAVSDTLHNAKFNRDGSIASGAGLRVFMDGMNFGRVAYDTKTVARTTTAVATAPTTTLYATNGANEFVGAAIATTSAGTPFSQAGTVAAMDIDSYVHSTNTTKINGTGNGSVTELYMDKDKNITLVTYHTYLFQAAGDYSSSTKTLNIVAGDDVETVALKDYKVKSDDFAQVADYKDGDYLLVTVAKTGVTYEVKDIEKAEIVSGKVTTFDTDSNQSVTLDGTLYKYSNKVTSDLKNTNFSVGQTAKLVLDKYGYVIAIDEALETSDYVFVLNWGATSGLGKDARAQVVFADGTDGEVTVKQAFDYDNHAGKTKASDITDKAEIASWNNSNTAANSVNAPSGGSANLMRWYTFSKNSSGEYSFYKVESKYEQHDVTYLSNSFTEDTIAENNKAAFLKNSTIHTVTGTPTNYLADDKTIALTRDSENDYSTYTGVKNMPEIMLKNSAGNGDSFVNAYILHKSNNYASLVFFYAEGKGTTVSGGEGENLVYVISFQTKTNAADSKVWYTYNMLDGTEEVKVQADKLIQNKNGDVYSAAFYTSKNSDGQLTNFREVKNNDSEGLGVGAKQKGSVYGEKGAKNQVLYSGSTISVGTFSFTVNNNTKTTLVTLKSANDMNSDKAADYEVFTGVGSAGARQVAALMENYTYTYDYAVKCTSKDSRIAEQIYVTVSGVTLATGDDSAALINQFGKTGAAGGAYTPTNGVAVLGAGKTLTLTTPMRINGDLVIRGTLDQNGNALTVTGTIYNYSSNTLKNTGASAIVSAGSLVNDGTLELNGTLTLGKDLELIGGTATFKGDVTVTGNTTITSDGKTDFQADLTTKDLTIVAQGETVLGTSTTNNVTVNGKMVVTATSAGETLKMNARSTITDTANSKIDTAAVDEANSAGDFNGTNASTYTVAADTALIKIAIV